MSDHDEMERVPADENLELSRRTMLRLGLLTIASTAFQTVHRSRSINESARRGSQTSISTRPAP